MELISDLKESLKGYKTYILVLFAIIAIAGQFLFEVDFGIPSIPPAENVGQFIEQIYQFLIIGTVRGAIGK